MEMTITERIKFLELVAQMAGNATFERILNLSPVQVNKYKKEFDVESSDDARVLLKRLRKQNIEGQEERVIEQTKHVREAERIANQRLAEIEAAKNAEKPAKQYDAKAIKTEDQERQRRFEAEQAEHAEPEEEWRLSLAGSQSQREDEIQRFRRNIENQGFEFCHKKYHATPKQIRFEAQRLGLDIDWDRVRR